MAVEITKNDNHYAACGMAQDSEVNSTRLKEVKKAPTAAYTRKSERMADYLNELAKLAPSLKVRAGITFSKVAGGKTLTISPGILNKMQNDPEKEKDMKEMIKGVEFITKFIDGLYKSSGKTLVYRHSFIDGDGRYYACSYVKNERSNKMSAKLRQARWNNSQNLIARSKETAAKRKKKLQETLREKRTRKADKRAVSGKAARFLEEKLTASKDGMVYLYDTDFKMLMKAASEDDAGKKDGRERAEAGANLDIQV
ncbi:hypothetical protein D3Z36_10900 [Lachnospiraceae bacterium]|nr:hypothetical protein [Lachnospiraceae bacterium]